MCGRYTLDDVADLRKRFNLATTAKDLRNDYNVAPTQTMPVVVSEYGKRSLELMRWGIPRFIGKGQVKDVFNTRSDKAFGSWKKLVMSQRVLVSATGFYEWKRLKETKQPYFIHPKDDELFSFAGIWNLWKDDDDREIKTYSIMTTEPNTEMSSVRHRMPVILHQGDESAWLASSTDNDRGALEALLRPYEDNGLEMYEVSGDVNVTRNNDEKLVYPLNSQ